MEIKFRGQRIDTKEWVYGYFVKAWDGTCYIITEFGSNVTCCDECGANAITVHEVIPETVGQYTGLKDKNGVEIYEGDILRDKDTGTITEIKWADKGFVLADRNGFYQYVYFTEEKEVIGNVWDNPELLKGVE